MSRQDSGPQNKTEFPEFRGPEFGGPEFDCPELGGLEFDSPEFEGPKFGSSEFVMTPSNYISMSSTLDSETHVSPSHL